MKKKAKSKKRVVREVILPYAIIGLSLLLLASVRSVQTPIDITLNVDEVSYKYLGSPGGSVLDSRIYSDVHVNNVTAATLVSKPGPSRVLVKILPRTEATSVSIGHAQMNQLYIPIGSRVSLRWSQHTLRISIIGNTALSLGVDRSTPLSCDYCATDRDPSSHEFLPLSLPTAATLSINASDPTVTLTAQPEESILAENMLVDNPSFLGGTAEWPTSSIIGPGKLTFPNADTAITVREREFLDIRKGSHLKMISMIPTKIGLQLHLSGQAKDIRVGDTGNRLPSLLERIVKNQPLALYCTAFGLVAGVLVKFMAQVNPN